MISVGVYLQIEILCWVGIASCFCCIAAMAVYFEAIGLDEQNVNKKCQTPKLAIPHFPTLPRFRVIAKPAKLGA